MRKISRFLYVCGVACLLAGALPAQMPSPEDFLGFAPGADRKLADMDQIIEYFRKLDQGSGRVVVEEVGKTTLGNPFMVVFITSEANHRDLEKYSRIQQRLADPRGLSREEAERSIRDGRAVVMINCSIHATEVGASQMSMQLAYDLASRDDPDIRRILDNVILLLTPMHNPDGTKMVVDWYREHLGTEFEGSRMPWLYHKYVGHDNNRDWFMFTQVETQLTIKVHNTWHPHVIVDMHQMGSNGARLFVPPFVDPYEPNIDPILRQQVAMMGTFIATELTAQGKAGVMHSTGFDAWTPARAYHHYHGGIRILTEAASVRIATPITVTPDRLSADVKEESVRMPLPWKGGRWSLGDIVAYDYAAAMAALTNAAGLRENWVRNYSRIFVKAVNRTGPPYAYVIPNEQRDLATAIKMLNILKMGGVEVHQAEAEFTADGHTYPAGSYLVFMAQPFGGFAKTLLERQVYPEIRETPGGPLKTPYDVVGHTLPLLMGVDAVKVDKVFQADTRLLPSIPKPRGRVTPAEGGAYGYAWGHASNDDIVALNRLLKSGKTIHWSAGEFEAAGRTFPAGTMLVDHAHALLTELNGIVQDLHVNFTALPAEPGVPVYRINPPRLGVYLSWTASMDEGWTRFVLEQFEFPYQSVTNSQIRKGGLGNDFDVILFPDMTNSTIVNGLSAGSLPEKYTGGIGEVGVKNIRSFIQGGGALITLNSAADFALKSLNLGVEDVAAGKRRQEFFIPGSLLKVIPDTTHPIAFGYDRDTAVFFRRSPVFSASEGHSVLRYPAHTLESGWVTGEELLFNRSALLDVPFGKGRVILIGFPAQYRSQSHGSFRFLFNAIFYGAATQE
ncbi:MAG: M14 metallopeptidase family protein [Candidatus Aminicenantaceae bacterium]